MHSRRREDVMKMYLKEIENVLVLITGLKCLRVLSGQGLLSAL
jgi:hypothetical protein